MTAILARERDLYETVWSSVEPYGAHAPGEVYLPLFLQMIGEARGTIFDAGCGSGKGALALQASGFRVMLGDVTDAGLVDGARALPFVPVCLWHDLRQAINGLRRWHQTGVDWTYCCDVLEHIPPQFTMLVVDQLLRITRRGLFLSISLMPDAFGVWAGRPLHQTVESFVWWRESLRELGEIAEARDLHENAVFLVRPHR